MKIELNEQMLLGVPVKSPSLQEAFCEVLLATLASPTTDIELRMLAEIERRNER